MAPWGHRCLSMSREGWTPPPMRTRSPTSPRLRASRKKLRPTSPHRVLQRLLKLRLRTRTLPRRTLNRRRPSSRRTLRRLTQWAIEDSEQLDSEEDYSEYARGDREFDDPDEFAEYIESHHVIMERAAEVMTGFRAGDWERMSIVRANYLLTDGAQQPGIPERPQSGDPAWEPAMECNADAEVRTQVLDGPNEDSHSPYTEIAAEYRWITDQDCDVPDPDHFYVYSMTTGDDALITDFSREQVSYEEDNPGMFD